MSSNVFDSPLLDRDEDTGTQSPKGTGKTLLGALREELSTPPVFEEYKVLKIPGKPKMAIKIRTNMTIQRLNNLRKRAYDKKSKEIDLAEFNIGIIARQTECLVLDGEDAVDDDDKFVNFDHYLVREMSNALDVSGCVRWLIPRDSDLLAIGAEIIEACGYGDQEDDDETDPLDSEND